MSKNEQHQEHQEHQEQQQKQLDELIQAVLRERRQLAYELSQVAAAAAAAASGPGTGTGQESTDNDNEASGVVTTMTAMMRVQLARVEALTAQLEAFMAGETATLQRARRAVLPPLQQQESLLSKMLALMPPSVFPTQTQQLAQQQPTGVNGPSDRNGSPPDLDVDVENRQDPRHDSSSSSSPSASDPAPQKSDSKPPRSLQLLTELEASRIPQYITRMTCDKINLAVAELNKLIEDKYTVLKMPQPKMNKLQRSLFWEHKQLMTPETKGHVFVTEKDLKDKEGWTKSTFKFDAVGRSVIAVLRHLGRIREVRGGGHTRIVLL